MLKSFVYLNLWCFIQEGQEALNRSLEFCLKLTYRYLLKAGHVPDDTWGGANFGTRGIIWTNLVEVHYVMLHTKYQDSRRHGFRQEEFFMFFLYISLCKTCDPQGRGKFFAPGG